MSKIVYVYARGRLPGNTESLLVDICRELEPDHVDAIPPRVVVGIRAAYAVMNPAIPPLEHGNSVLIGSLFESTERWWEPATACPDGNYALFRENERFVETVSDAAGSRTIWYTVDPALFVASTSQRAIAMIRGQFDFNEKVVPWMLSSGTLGPTEGWDKFVQRVPPDGRVLLDKTTWVATTEGQRAEFTLSNLSDTEHERDLRHALDSTFSNLNLETGRWALGLSGGYDSRAVLSLLSEVLPPGESPPTVSWGLGSAPDDPRSDAAIARRLAEAHGVPYSYISVLDPVEDAEAILERFLSLGEGRIDHIAGYADGLQIWKELFDSGISGLIRGDEGFGWSAVSSELDARQSVGLALCDDIDLLKRYRHFGLPEHSLPAHLQRKPQESIEMWRDRLYHGFRLPTMMAALSDLKLGYVELMNPLLSKRVLLRVRTVPDHLRTDKALFKRMVDDLGPEVEYATETGLEKKKHVVKRPEFTEILLAELHSERAEAALPSDFLTFLARKKTESLSAGHGFSATAARRRAFKLSRTLRRSLLGGYGPSRRGDPNTIAFRAFIASRMNAMLTEDARRFAEAAQFRK